MDTNEDRARSLFLAALERPAAEWLGYLDEAASAGEPAVRARAEALLNAHLELGSIQAGPLPVQSTVDLSSLEQPGTAIGPYKLLEEIGEGGFGTVFLAEQTAPIRRKVALKVLKPGMDTRQVVARFEAERQALAIMDHQNIARVFDGGVTPSGRPYFVMELVKGTPITEFCDQHRLSPRMRLELFVQVCQAVQHAHQKGIIHRDIKPSNVLVSRHDTTPVVKVIDFGVAKALGQVLTDKTLFTGIAQMIGTPLYMSPEQAGMSDLDVDTRSDIYSLGVLLYELLTGSTPFPRERFKGAGYDEIRRIIREEEPARPSTRLSTVADLPTVAANRGVEPRRLSGQVRGELDWVVMKALEKDRTRRYETAIGFAADVQRHLAGDAVLAVPPSAGYRLRKFARRNKRALATATILAGALLVSVGTVAGSVGWAARDRADRQVRTAAEVEHYLHRAESYYADNRLPDAVAEVQKAASVMESGGGDDDLRRRVQEWASDLDMSTRVEEEFILRDYRGRAANSSDYARVFREYGLDTEAMTVQEAASRVAGSRIKRELIIALLEWARLNPSAGEMSRRRLEVARVADPDSPLLLIAEAEGDARRLRELVKTADLRLLGRAGVVYLGFSLLRTGEATDAAMKLLSDARRQNPGDFLLTSATADAIVTHSRATAGERHPRMNEIIAMRFAAVALRPKNAVAHAFYGNALMRSGYHQAAIAACREAVRLRPEWEGGHTNLALALSAVGNQEEALAVARAAVALAPEDSIVRAAMARVLEDGGFAEEAIVEYREAIRIGPMVEHYLSLGNVLRQKGRFDEAETALGEGIRQSPTWSMLHLSLGMVRDLQGRVDDAIASYREAVRLAPNYAEAYAQLGSALRTKGALEDSVKAFEKALQAKPDFPQVHFNLGVTLFSLGHKGEALAAYRAAIRQKPDLWEAHDNLGWTLAWLGRLEEGLSVYEKAIRRLPSQLQLRLQLASLLVLGPDPKMWNAKRALEVLAGASEAGKKEPRYWWYLAMARCQNGDWKESMAAFRKSWELRRGHRSADGFFVAMIAWHNGNPDEARKWYAEAARWLDANPAQLKAVRPVRDQAATLLGIAMEPEVAPLPRVKP